MTTKKASVARRRFEVRRVDRLLGEDAVPAALLAKTERLMPRLRDHLRTMQPTVTIKSSELEIMYAVLAHLLHPAMSDSLRRQQRDHDVAVDYLFHKEYLGHRSVLDGVCARWGMSESAVKQAVKRHRDDARTTIKAMVLGDEQHRQLNPDDPNEEPFEKWFGRAVRSESDRYRESLKAKPRRARSAK